MFDQSFDRELVFNILTGFLFNSAILFLIIFLVYFRKSQRIDFSFTFFLIGSIVFFLSYLMGKVEVNFGFALGLFAIFGIIRYRTDQIPIKEMTYLFIVIGISLMNAITGDVISFWETLIANVSITILIFIYEFFQSLRKEASRIMIYDKMELLKSGMDKLLLADLKEITGLDVYRVEVTKYNMIKKSALIRVYYHPVKNGVVTDAPEIAPGFDTSDED